MISHEHTYFKESNHEEVNKESIFLLHIREERNLMFSIMASAIEKRRSPSFRYQWFHYL